MRGTKMTNIPKFVTIKEIRRELLYFGSDKFDENEPSIQAYTYDGKRADIANQGMQYEDGGGLGDFNGKQIIFEMMRYLLAIFMFSIHRLQLNPEKKANYEKEIKDYEAIFKKFDISFTGLQEELWIMRDFMTSNLTEFYGSKSKEFFKRSTNPSSFYDIELTSKPLIYLLFFFTGYGGSQYLIKDFKAITQQAEEKSYQKQQFITQTSVSLYREDFLLTMMLEPLSGELTPDSLINIYNRHLENYNQLLKKDKEKGLSLKKTGYNPDKSYGAIKSEVAPHAKLFPEKHYSDKFFPDFITGLTHDEKIKIIEIISNLYNLDFDEESLEDSIKRFKIDSNIIRVKKEYKRFKEMYVKDDNIRSWQYFVADDKDFLALQAFWSANKDLHLVFNERIIDILNQFEVNHPFLYVDTY